MTTLGPILKKMNLVFSRQLSLFQCVIRQTLLNILLFCTSFFLGINGLMIFQCKNATATQWTWVWITPGDSEGQGSLACCSPRGCRESDTTQQLNNNVKMKDKKEREENILKTNKRSDVGKIAKKLQALIHPQKLYKNVNN